MHLLKLKEGHSFVSYITSTGQNNGICVICCYEFRMFSINEHMKILHYDELAEGLFFWVEGKG